MMRLLSNAVAMSSICFQVAYEKEGEEKSDSKKSSSSEKKKRPVVKFVAAQLEEGLEDSSEEVTSSHFRYNDLALA